MAGKMRPAFVRLHVATLDPDTTADQMATALAAADAVQDRHRLSEGAVYMSAQRRYQMLTGTDWRDSRQPEAAASWGESDHRLRVRLPVTNPTGWGWACSCGATGGAPTAEDCTAAHADHLAAVGVPA